MTYPNNPYGQQFTQQGFGGQQFPPFGGQQFPPPAPAHMPAFGQQPVGTVGSGIWPRASVGRFVIGTWLTVASSAIGLAGLAAPVLALLAMPVGIGAWVYLIGGLIASGREKRDAPVVTDPVMDVALKIAAFTPEQDQRFEQIAEAMDKGEFPPQPGYGQQFPPPQYHGGL